MCKPVDNEFWPLYTHISSGSHFQQKNQKNHPPLLVFNNTYLSKATSQKHLGTVLDTPLTFEEHLKRVVGKPIKTISLFYKLWNNLTRAQY